MRSVAVRTSWATVTVATSELRGSPDLRLLVPLLTHPVAKSISTVNLEEDTKETIPSSSSTIAICFRSAVVELFGREKLKWPGGGR